MRVLIWLCICLNLAAAGLLSPIRRDGPPPTAEVTPLPKPSNTGDESSAPTVQASSSDSTPTVTASPPHNASEASSTTKTSSASFLIPTESVTSTTLNGTLFNSTIPAGQLPLAPRITPGWAVSGVLLIGAGAAYTLVGIKSKWLSSFFSTAALGSLGVTVLIVYVMTPPVRDAIQGAYVVAVVCTGIVLGGAAIVFRDTTECMACLLGGFCLSMWLLSLRAGGLLPATSPKVVFIVVISAASFALYFTRWTRLYALIGCISFSGATAVVLGIDCFSRAGLKEFWAYIWALNDNLFPLGTTTYPITRGMRVEIAVTVIIAITGIISQLKLWKIVRERREKRDAERAEAERHLREEEENAGRMVLEENERERGAWERQYGDRSRPTSGAARGYADSGVADVDSEKKARNSGTVVTVATTTRARSSAGEPIEMREIPLASDEDAIGPSPPLKVAEQQPQATILSKDGSDGGAVTVRVAQDDVPVGPPAGSDSDRRDGPGVWEVGSDGEARPAADNLRKIFRITTPVPDVVPLPFNIDAQVAAREVDERSSVATFADEDGEVRSMAADSSGNSIARRLSASSAQLLRSLSQRSKANSTVIHDNQGESREELISPEQIQRDDTSSVAANLDFLSENGSEPASGRTTPLIPDNHGVPTGVAGQAKEEAGQSSADATVADATGAITTDALEASRGEDTNAHTEAPRVPSDATKFQDATGATGKTVEETTTRGRKKQAAGPGKADFKLPVPEQGPRGAKSIESSDSSRASSLTRGNLPTALSRVALSYRTNEWAKHLSIAETPEPEDLHLGDMSNLNVPLLDDNEPAAPVDVGELQKTAENGVPPPAVPRSASAPSIYALYQPGGSPMGAPGPGGGLSQNPYRSISANLNRRTSGGLLAEPIAEEGNCQPRTSSPSVEGSISSRPSANPSPIPHDPSASSTPTPPPGLGPRPSMSGLSSQPSRQTLMGQRESFLRSKSQVSFYQTSPTPEPAMMPHAFIIPQPTSDAGSMYNYPPTYSSATIAGPDADDIPLSRRRELMRQSSASTMRLGGGGGQPAATPTGAFVTVDSIGFDSHQPQRSNPGGAVSEAARQAQLAQFRSSVAADLRAGTPVVSLPGAIAGGGVSTLRASSSSASLLSTAPGLAGVAKAAYAREADVRRSVDAQRSYLLSLKEAEAQRRERERLEKERGDREFEERMRRGELLEAHREAMRRLQGGVKGA
ncbi:hypothetical protein VTK73DRAFT_2610 [Phialemonium thermophilum]|uniref:TM7S3/TM198-like domain-containing protein n=1 Tax=Phialemonium thermophilum TaxID=223376 RepID=A0ABR3X486_9PEZI